MLIKKILKLCFQDSISLEILICWELSVSNVVDVVFVLVFHLVSPYFTSYFFFTLVLYTRILLDTKDKSNSLKKINKKEHVEQQYKIFTSLPLFFNLYFNQLIHTHKLFFCISILSYLLFSLRFLYIKIKFFTNQFLSKSSIYKWKHSHDIKISHHSYWIHKGCIHWKHLIS